jgi:thymidylate kinase
MDIDPTANVIDVDGHSRPGRGAIVLLEGLDATGKSTAVGRLYNMLSAPVAVYHAGAPLMTTAIREYVWPLGIAPAGYTVFCDRWHLGELVWPEIFDRDGIIEDGEMLRHIEENMLYLRVPILAVYMNRSYHDIERELTARGHQVDHLERAEQLYQVAMKESRFDWQDATLATAPRMIVEWLDSQLQ